MTYKQWLKFDEAEQIEAIWEGKLVGSRNDCQFTVSLYDLNGLFVEVFYNAKLNFIQKFEPLLVNSLEAAHIGYRLN